MNKNIFGAALLSFGLLFTNASFANDNGTKKELISDIKIETKKCAVQIVAVNTDSEQVQAFRSVCNTLVIVSRDEAQIQIEGEWLTAKITESAESDGGDLDDLAITNANGQVLATKTNIPAYDSVVVAMAGDSNLRKIHTRK